MKVAGLFLSGMDNRSIYPIAIYDKQLTGEEKRLVAQAIGDNGQLVDGGYNQWRILKTGNLYSAFRMTWDVGGINGTGFDEFLKKLNEYHAH